MKVHIEVILDVEPCGDPKPGDPFEDCILDSVQEAVSTVLHHAQGVGFPHALEAELSITVAEVGPAKKV